MKKHRSAAEGKANEEWGCAYEGKLMKHGL